MPTQTEIARDWGVAKSYVHKCVKKGCPTDSFENARDWRLAHASNRETTNPGQLARIVHQELADDSPEAREHRKEFFENAPEGVELPKELDIDDARFFARQAVAEAYRLLRDAMAEKKDSKIGVRLSVHNKALDQLYKSEAAHREELERRRVLIPLSEAQDMARRGFEIIIQRLSALPQNTAPRCNPHDPHHAMGILQAECIGIIADAQKAFAL